MPSFTQNISDLLNKGPIISLTIAPAHSLTEILGGEFLVKNSVNVAAMIDTGANSTVIKKGLASALNLIPVGTGLMYTPSSENIVCYRYNVQLIFPTNIVIEEVTVIEAPLQGQHIQCLIGRDVLKHGIFFYNGNDNSFTLSF